MSTIVAPTIGPGEEVLQFGGGSGNRGDAQAVVSKGAYVTRATDPLVLPQPYAQPADFAAQYPIPLDPTEVIAMCEEVTLWNAIPEEESPLNGITWRELNQLAFTSGSSYISFADGECPEEFTHDGTNTTVNHKNIGTKKSLSQRDIKHSMAVAGFGINGINRLVGGVPTGEGVPGGSDSATFAIEAVAGVKEKEVRLGEALVLNGWDRLLAVGNATSNSLEFDGVENVVTTANGSHNNDAAAPSGTFSAATYDRFLSASCAKPTHIFGHPQAVQEMLSSYFQLGYQGSQIVNFADGDRITPGYNFAGFVNTGVGRLAVVADNNFTRVDLTGSFVSRLYGLRMTHNGEPLVYKSTQIQLQMVDLVPGCTAISFEIWAASALIIKHRCAHSKFTATFTGNVTTTCPSIG